MPAGLVLELLGAPRLRDGAGRERALPSRRALALLAVLAAEGEVTRSRLATLFWGELDDASARRNLRRELARLRSEGLEATFSAVGDRLRLGADIASDIDAFRGAAAVRRRRGRARRLARAPARRLRAGRGGGFPRVARRAARPPHPALARAGGAAGGALRRPPATRAPRSTGTPAWSTTTLCRSCTTSTSCACTTCSASAGPRSPPGSAAARCCATSSASRRRRRRSPSPSRSARPSGCRRWRCVAPTRRCAASRRRSSAARPRWRGCASREHRPAVLLEGEAGVGKTRLAQEVLRAGSTVAVRCEAIAREAPLHAVTEALRALLEAPERLARLDSLGADDRREVARLLPALAAERGPHALRRVVPPARPTRHRPRRRRRRRRRPRRRRWRPGSASSTPSARPSTASPGPAAASGSTTPNGPTSRPSP